uniref:Uncharacterized protein n=1 Tax=Zea mays TaxID=4577 RepID=A0A804QT07_MAIZE
MEYHIYEAPMVASVLLTARDQATRKHHQSVHKNTYAAHGVVSHQAGHRQWRARKLQRRPTTWTPSTSGSTMAPATFSASTSQGSRRRTFGCTWTARAGSPSSAIANPRPAAAARRCGSTRRSSCPIRPTLIPSRAASTATCSRSPCPNCSPVLMPPQRHHRSPRRRRESPAISQIRRTSCPPGLAVAVRRRRRSGGPPRPRGLAWLRQAKRKTRRRPSPWWRCRRSRARRRAETINEMTSRMARRRPTTGTGRWSLARPRAGSRRRGRGWRRPRPRRSGRGSASTGRSAPWRRASGWRRRSITRRR